MRNSCWLCSIILMGAFLMAGRMRSAPAGPPSSGNKPKKVRLGIEKRVPWTTSRITGSPEPPPPYSIQRVFPKLKFNNPVVLTNAPGAERLFLAELRGKIYSFPSRPRADDGSAMEKPDLFADLAQGIKGLRRVYGLTFHPGFQQNRLCYICYVLAENQPDGTRVSQFRVKADEPPSLDVASEEVLITWRSGGHNGGCLKFGPDGFLYISTGDGAPAFPPDEHDTGQDVSDLLASILRIDVDRGQNGRPYAIPQDNPFVGRMDARGEVWCYGLRNPWKMSFDPVTGHLWVGDVGWEMWELVYRIQKGGNYGWSLVEGPQPVHRERRRGPTPLLEPTMVHSHTESRSVTGGFVYRGRRLKELVGAYIYGDYVTGKIWGLRHDGKNATWLKELVDTPLQIICFGVDNAGELYIVGYDGTIYRLVATADREANRDFPTRLSETGLFASVKDHVPAAGVIGYSINAEPWMDTAIARRLLALPGESRLGIHDTQNVQAGTIKGAWKFPNDAVLAKTISLPLERDNPARLRRLETQILHHDRDTWRPYTYVWNDEQTDAVLLGPDGEDRTFTIHDPAAPGGQRKLTWHFASRTECIVCHTTRAGLIHGFNVEQLNKPHEYGQITAGQLETFGHIGLFEKPIEPEPSRMPNPFDESLELDQRARAYLHVNCAHCHRRGGGGTAALVLRREFPLEKLNLLGARPTQGTFAIHGAAVVAAGDPYRSVLYYRMAKLGRGRMPYFGSGMVDAQGLKLIHDWIEALPAGTGTTSAARRRAVQQDLVSQLTRADLADRHGEIMDQLLSSASGALLLLRAVDDGRLPDDVKRNLVAKTPAHPQPAVRDLFERFLPEEKRVKRLGSVVNPQQLLALRGDSAAGRRLFLTVQGVQCRNCHRVGGQGKALGPDLDGIGKKLDRPALLESILQPSKRIDPKFLAYVVETKDGLVHLGLLAERGKKEIVLRDAAHKLIRIPADNVERMAPQQKSIMPDLLVRDLTAQQVADLLEFLASLK